MSDTSILTQEAKGGRQRVVRGGLAVALVALLVGGSAMLAGAPNAPYEDATGLISGLYADGDATAMIDRWDPRFTAQFGDQIDQLRADVAGLLAENGQVVGEQAVVVAGVPIVQVVTSDQIRWCVRPDGVILPTCVLGTMTASADAGSLGLDVDVIGGGLDLDGAEVTFDLVSDSVDAVTLTGPGELGDSAGPWSLVAATQLAGGEFFPPAEDGTLTVGGAFSIRVTFRAALGGGGQVDATSFDLVFPEGTIRVTIPSPEYWFN